LVVTATALALNALATFAQGRYLGPEARGIIAAIYNVPNLAFIVGSFGLTNAAGYFAGRDPRHAGGVSSTLAIVLAIWSIPFTLAIYLLLPHLLASQSQQTVELASLFLLSVPLQFVGNVPLAALQGTGRMAEWNVLRLLAPASLFAVTLLALKLPGNPLRNLVQIHLVTIGILVTISWIVAAFRFPRPFVPCFERLPEMMKFGIPAGLTTLPAQLNLRVDQVVMAVVVPARVLGVYSLSVAWAALVVPVFAAMGQVLFPRLVAQSEGEEQRRSIAHSSQHALGVGLLAASVLTACSYWLLPLIFGDIFRDHFLTVVALIVANVFAGMNQLLGDAFRGLGETRPPMWAEGTGFVVTVISLVPLVRAYGATGAAAVSVVAYAATTAVLLTAFARLHGLPPSVLMRPKLPLERFRASKTARNAA
jgi:O-antigen/teichoic acid export membrane protein